MELPQLGRECMRLVNPKRHEDLEMLHVTFTRVMGGYIKGTLLQCAIIGVGCVVLFGAIGIPNYAALGGIAGLLNIIPIVGPWLGGALAAIVGVDVYKRQKRSVCVSSTAGSSRLIRELSAASTSSKCTPGWGTPLLKTRRVPLPV